jgi:hypothetical protein
MGDIAEAVLFNGGVVLQNLRRTGTITFRLRDYSLRETDVARADGDDLARLGVHGVGDAAPGDGD